METYHFITETWSGHLGETEIHFGCTKVLGFGRWQYTDNLGESGWDLFGGTEMDFRVLDRNEVEK